MQIDEKTDEKTDDNEPQGKNLPPITGTLDIRDAEDKLAPPPPASPQEESAT